MLYICEKAPSVGIWITVAVRQTFSNKLRYWDINSNPKWISLLIFVLQNSLLIIGMKACTIYTSLMMDQYISSTAVVLAEFVKLILSTCLCFYNDAHCDFFKFRDLIFAAFIEDGSDCIKLCLPAILYAIQNNLQYIIEEAPLFLVLYQAKIITTAAFYSYLLSKKRITNKEWMTVVGLAIGVGMVESSQLDVVPQHASDFVGIASVGIACLTSGLAGVYFEKILKTSRSSIWLLNMQLSMLSCFFCSLVTLTQDVEEIARHGLLTGYNSIVLLIILLQGLTGIAVALVVKYADSIIKSYAQAVSIVICLTLSAFLFDDTTINQTFLMGSFLVVMSCGCYAILTHPHEQHIYYLPTPLHPHSAQKSNANRSSRGIDHMANRESVYSATNTPEAKNSNTSDIEGNSSVYRLNFDQQLSNEMAQGSSIDSESNIILDQQAPHCTSDRNPSQNEAMPSTNSYRRRQFDCAQQQNSNNSITYDQYGDQPTTLSQQQQERKRIDDGQSEDHRSGQEKFNSNDSSVDTLDEKKRKKPSASGANSSWLGALWS